MDCGRKGLTFQSGRGSSSAHLMDAFRCRWSDRARWFAEYRWTAYIREPSYVELPLPLTYGQGTRVLPTPRKLRVNCPFQLLLYLPCLQ
jgi:hypothetical protein